MTIVAPTPVSGSRYLPEQRAMAIDACLHLAAKCVTARRWPEAIRYFRKAVDLGENTSAAHLALGNALELTGALDEAARSFECAIACEPNHPEALFRLGSIHLRQHRGIQAIGVYREAHARDPRNIRIIHNLANLMIEIEGKYDEVHGLVDAALAIEPDNGKLLWSMTIISQNLGHFDRARKCLQRIVELDRLNANAHRMLSLLTDYRPGDQHHAAMQVAYAASASDPASRVHLGFGLFKAFDDLGDHDEAFFHLEEANRLHCPTVSYDRQATAVLLDNIRSTFSREFMDRYCDFGFEDARPIFIVGMPCSGTTLCEQILSRHPDVCAADELELMPAFSRKLFPGYQERPNQPLSDRIRPEMLRMIGRSYREKLAKLAAGEARSTDKMPINFMWVGLIKLALPNARFIHCRRDPVDTCFSIYASLFTGAGNNFAYDLSDIAAYHRGCDELMAHWKDLLPNDIVDFHYSEVQDDQESTTRRLLSFCDLAWEGDCRHFQGSGSPGATLSNTKVHQPLKTDGLRRAAPYLRHLGALTTALGDP